MPKREIRTTLALDGEAAYKQAIDSINREMRVLDSELSAVSASFGKNQSSVQALTAKNTVLTKEIDQQRTKVLSLRQAVDEASQKYGDADKKTDGYRIQLNNAEAALAKLNNQLKANEAEIAKQSNSFYQAGTALNAASKNMKSIGDHTKNAGEALTRGLTVPILGAVTALGLFINKELQAIGEIQKFSDVTGVSAERIQELSYVGKQIDMDYETLISSQAKLTRGMAQAKGGNKQQIEAFRELGVNILDANGNLRDSKAVMMETIDALNGVGNETERDAIALNIFGRSALELNPLIKTGSAEIARLSAEAHQVGAVLSNEVVAALDTFGDSIEATKLALMTMGASAINESLPALQSIFNSFKQKGIPAIKGFLEMVVNLVDGFMKLPASTQKLILALAGIAVSIGPVLTGVGSLITAVGSITAVMGSASLAIAGAGGAMAVLTGPVGIAIAAIAALTAGTVLWASTASDAADAAKALADQCNSTAKAFLDNVDGIDHTASAASELVDQLNALAGKQQRTNEENYRMAGLVAQLNQLYPTLNLQVDEHTGKLNLNKAAIMGVIQQQKAQVMLEAYQQRAVELYKEKAALTDEMAEAMKRNTAAAKQYVAVGAEGAMGVFHLKEVRESAAAADAIGILNGQLEANSNYITANDEAMNAWASTYSAANDKMAASGGNAALLTAEEQSALEAQLQEHQQKIESMTEQHMTEMGDLSQRSIEKDKLSAQQVKKNLDQQIADFQAWRDQMRLVSVKLPDDVTNDLEELGPKSIKIIQGLNKMTPKELDAWVKTWREKAALARQAAEEELGSGSTAATTAGTETGANYAAAMEAQKPAVQDAGAALATAAQTGATVSLAAEGAKAGQSFADAIRSKVDAARQAAEALAAVVPVSVRSTLDMHSPSRVMDAAGDDTSGGYLQGLLRNLGLIRSASRDIGLAAVPDADISALSALKPASYRGAAFMRQAGAAASNGADGGGVVRHVHSGVVRIEGYNSDGEFDRAYDYFVDRFMAENRA